MESEQLVNFDDLNIYVSESKSAEVQRARPTRCLVPNPTPQNVYFGGEFISLTDLSRQTGISVSGLSHIFRRKRDPSLRAAEAIAQALGMRFGDFVETLRDHFPDQ